MTEPIFLEELDYSLRKAFESAVSLCEPIRPVDVSPIKVIGQGSAYTFEGGRYGNAIIIQRVGIEGESWQFQQYSTFYEDEKQQSANRLRLSRVFYELRIVANSNKEDSFLSKVFRTAIPANGIVGDACISIYTVIDDLPTLKTETNITLQSSVTVRAEKEVTERIFPAYISDVLLYELEVKDVSLIENITLNQENL